MPPDWNSSRPATASMAVTNAWRSWASDRALAALGPVVGRAQVPWVQHGAVGQVAAQLGAHAQVVPVLRHGALHVAVAGPAAVWQWRGVWGVHVLHMRLSPLSFLAR